MKRSKSLICDWFKFIAARVNIGFWMFDPMCSGSDFAPEPTARSADIEIVSWLNVPITMNALKHYAKVGKLCSDKVVRSGPGAPPGLTLSGP